MSITVASVVAWLRQPTSILGLSTIVGAGASLLTHEMTYAAAVPIAIGGLVAMVIPENPKAQSAAVAVAGDLITGVAGHQSSALLAERVAADVLQAVPVQTAIAVATVAEPQVAAVATELAPVGVALAPGLAKVEAAL